MKTLINRFSYLWVLLIVFTLLGNCDVYSQKKITKALIKADEKFEYGDYSKALDLLEKFKVRAEKELGKENKFIVDYYLREAEYYMASGIVIELPVSIQNALQMSEKVHGKNSVEYVATQMEVSRILTQYGDFNQAYKMVESARNILSEINVVEDRYKAKLDLIEAMALGGQGFYVEALDYIKERESYFLTRTAPKESFVDENGKLKSRMLDAIEIQNRNGDFAALLMLKAIVLGEMGRYDDAYNSFLDAKEWISGNKLLGKKSMEYVVNQYNFINFQLDNGLDPDNLGNDEQYDKLLTLVKKDHSEAHYLAFDIYESLLKQYLVNRKSARYRTLRVEYERAIEKNFKKQSLHYKNLDALEFNAKLSKDKTRNLEDKAKTILADFQSLPEYHSKRVMILGFMYRVSIKNRDFQHAETYLKNIIDIEKHLYGEESPKYHLSMVRLANFYMDYTSKIADAKDIYDHSFEKIVKRQITTSHNDYLTIITHLASLYEYQDELGKSAQTLDLASKAALEKYRNPEDIEYGKVLEKIGDLQIKMGDYISAEKNINQALDIYDKAKVKRDEYNVINLVKAYETKARLLGIKGEFDDAEELINSAEDLLEGALTLEGYDDLKAKDELVSLQIYLGKFSDSNENLNQILKEYRKLYGENSGKLVNPLINKGRLSLLLGEYTEAEKIAREANRIAVNIFGENSSKTAETLSLLGELYTLLGDYERAIQSINSAISIKKRKFGEEHITVAIDLAKLGTAKYYKGDPDTETEPILLSAKKIISEKLNEQNPRFADINKSLALIYIRSGRFSDAFGALTVAENIWLSKTGRGGRRNVNVGGIYILTGDAYYHQKNYIKAEESYEKARIIYRRALRENHPEYIKILSKLSKANYMQGEYEESKSKIEEAMANYKVFIKDYFPALSEREKAKFWNTIRPDFEFYNTLILRNINDDKDAVGKIYNNALMTKALLLNSSIKIRERIMSSSDEELKERYSEWVDKKEFLTKVLAMSEEQLVENSINPLRLTQEVETLERQLSQSSSLFSQNIEESAVTWNQVRGSLKNNEAALEMVRFRYFDHVFTDSIIYAGLYVKNSAEFKQPGIVMLNNGYDLENRNFIFYRRSLEFGVGDNRSYGMYWEPIAKEIGEQYSVYFSPDGVFNLINLESLPTGEGKYVIDNSNIILVSNTKDIYLNKNKPKAVRSEESMALMFGNPDFYLEASSKHTLPDLPGTEKEVRQLRRLMVDNGISSDYFTSFEATEEQIKSLKSPEILHIATHGFFQEEKKQQEDDMEYNEAEAANNPLLRTGLVLTGGGDIIEKSKFNFNIESGILTAYEAMSLNLDDTDLVVLSACETGLGEIDFGEGVYGLQRAFLVAGAKMLIMSMQKVDDEATQKLMVNFYKKWIETGDMRKSFVEAKKELRMEYGDRKYWGAFVMIGMG